MIFHFLKGLLHLSQGYGSPLGSMKYQTGLAGQSCALGVQNLVLGHAKHHQEHLNGNQIVLDKDSGFAFRVVLLTFSCGLCDVLASMH